MKMLTVKCYYSVTESVLAYSSACYSETLYNDVFVPKKIYILKFMRIPPPKLYDLIIFACMAQYSPKC